MENTIRYNIKSEPCNRGPLSFQASRVGVGAYAQAFLATEVVASADGAILVQRNVVAKVFLDEAPDDRNIAFEKELDVLREFSTHNNIVGLRGMERRRPPTFVCGAAGCGMVFEVGTCPECSDGTLLQNESDVSGRPTIGAVLQCGKKHTFNKRDEADDRLQAKRSCKHKDKCDTVNFLFRECIYLDALHVNLREFSDLLRYDARTLRGHRVYTTSRATDKRNDARKRETFLMRLAALVEVADALEYVHACGRLHGDIAPENIMLSLSRPIDAQTPQSQITKLIDFGQARPKDSPRDTVIIHGRSVFVAPEMSGVNNSIETSATIQPEGPFTIGGECYLVCRTGLADGDYVWDNDGGKYEVIQEEVATGMVPPGDEALASTLPAPSKASRSNALRTNAEGSKIQENVTDALTKAEEHVQSPSSSETADEHHETDSLIDSVRRDLDNRRYRLRILGISTAAPGNALLLTNQAIRVPADIYSFGCVLAWLVTDGSNSLVQQMRDAAGYASSQSTSVDKVLKDKPDEPIFKNFLSAMPLPKSSEDQEVRRKLLEVVYRCLMRGEGAYAEGRSRGFEGAASKAAHDLRLVHDRLFFIHRIGSEYKEFLEHGPAEEVQGLKNQVRSLETDKSKTETDLNDALKEVGRLTESKQRLNTDFAAAKASLRNLRMALIVLCSAILFLAALGVYGRKLDTTSDPAPLPATESVQAPAASKPIPANSDSGLTDGLFPSPRSTGSGKHGGRSGPAVLTETTVVCSDPGAIGIAGGSIKFGKDEQPTEVPSFCLDVTEVTVEKYKSCVSKKTCSSIGSEPDVATAWAGQDPYTIKDMQCNSWKTGRDSHAVNCVSARQAEAYCKSIQGGRLPTEVEWEFAARGPDPSRRYPWGSNEPSREMKVCFAEEAGWPCPVKSNTYDKTPGGIYDLAGNVQEWTKSLSGTKEPFVLKGGYFKSGLGLFDRGPKSSPAQLEATARFPVEKPSTMSIYTGFRCAYDAVAGR